METASLPALKEQAIQLVRELLPNVCRLCGETAIDHCLRVGDNLESSARNLGEPLATYTVCAGYLHDILEDAVDWNDVESRGLLRKRIETEFGHEVLRIVDAVTVDQRLSAEDQFAIFRDRARSEFLVPELLVKLADILDNWKSRHVYNATYLKLWEKFAKQMIERVIPERLLSHNWNGSIPFSLT